MLYGQPVQLPRWVEVVIWAAMSGLLLYVAIYGLMLRHLLGWKTEVWSVLMIVVVGVWGYSLLHPHGKLWRAFHPAEWGTGHENPRR